jgi:hypothetical protein
VGVGGTHTILRGNEVKFGRIFWWKKTLQINETLWEPSIPRGDVHILALFWSDHLTQSYGPWLVMQYAYRIIIVSAPLPCNYWQEFNERSWEQSKPRGDAHIIALFRFYPSAQSYGPWLDMQYAYRAIIVSALLLCNTGFNSMKLYENHLYRD